MMMRVMVMVVMTAGAAFMVMVMAAAATIMMTMVVFVVMVVLFPGMDGHFTFYRPGKLGQLFDQLVRMFGAQPQLTGGESDGSFLHLRQGIEFGLYFCRAVCAV